VEPVSGLRPEVLVQVLVQVQVLVEFLLHVFRKPILLHSVKETLE
jgi:hypothetical protein